MCKNNPVIPEIKVSYANPMLKNARISCAEEAYKYLRPLYDDDTIEYVESVYALFLNRKNNILGWRMLSVGGTSHCLIDAKVLFGVALKCNASAIILSHNHPSGNLTPSDKDLELTNQLEELGKMLGVMLLDHLIITTNSYYSIITQYG